MNLANKTGEGFQQQPDKYAAYLETVQGRLRLDLTIAEVDKFLPLPSSKRPLRALDVGGGTGAAAVELARRGVEVTLLDSSLAMMEIAERAAKEADVDDRVVLQQGDAAQAGKLFAGELFDIVLCHNVLEYVECPGAVLRESTRLMRRDPPALLSIVVRNRAGEVLKAAIQTGDLEAAEKGLTADWGVESLYGGRVRLFTPDVLLAMSKEVGLEVIAQRGVRVVADYLPPQISRKAEYERTFELERKLGQCPEFAAVARYTHFLARCARPVMEDVG
jgi:S-adenosylmethionine-dependent methyltransferase